MNWKPELSSTGEEVLSRRGDGIEHQGLQPPPIRAFCPNAEAPGTVEPTREVIERFRVRHLYLPVARALKTARKPAAVGTHASG